MAACWQSGGRPLQEETKPERLIRTRTSQKDHTCVFAWSNPPTLNHLLYVCSTKTHHFIRNVKTECAFIPSRQLLVPVNVSKVELIHFSERHPGFI